MATVKKLFIFSTTFLSGIAVLITIICLATEQWIYTDKLKIVSKDNFIGYYNHLKYGLFQGTYRQVVPTTNAYQITITCLAEKNICAFICANSTDMRYSILKDIYDGKDVNINIDNCPKVSTYHQYYNRPIQLHTSSNSVEKIYINCGVWVSTILFLVISITFGFISASLSLYNTVSNPVQVYLSIYGLFIYTAIAACSSSIAIILWGIHYHKNIFHNVAFFYTLTGEMSSDKTAYLGYSYWLNLIPIVLYISSICVLYAREYLISRDPKQKIVHREEHGDPIIYLY
ncbi:clarin-3-like [Diorhabda carinulata]|uniref:clarin-3-like n=1 Tax=Diorhabda carinulata TaxID=1163345 RepID=UPI0025A2A8CD|nr:clarin-3-like [Diorhabda carinulata]